MIHRTTNLLCLTKESNFYNQLLIKISKKPLAIYTIILLIIAIVGIDDQTIRSNEAYATAPSLTQGIQQFQDNIRTFINNTIKSIVGDSDCQFNFSLNLQTTNNDQTISTSKNYCNNEFLSLIFSPDDKYSNLRGTIVNVEYDTKTDNIINSVFGNWSFLNNENNQIDFKSSFTKKSLKSLQPIQSINETSSSLNKNNYEFVKYGLSNFKVNSISESNSNIKFQGTMDVTRETQSSDNNSLDGSMSFKGIKISIAIFNSKTLLINFDPSSNLFKEFKDIPIVGIAK